jgi:hypothetical protein
MRFGDDTGAARQRLTARYTGREGGVPVSAGEIICRSSDGGLLADDDQAVSCTGQRGVNPGAGQCPSVHAMRHNHDSFGLGALKLVAGDGVRQVQLLGFPSSIADDAVAVIDDDRDGVLRATPI